MLKKIFFSVFVTIMMMGCATTPKQETVTVYRTFDISSIERPGAVVEAVKTAMSLKADNLTATTGIVPDELSDKPGSFEINVQQMSMPFGISFAFPRVECKNCYSLITNMGSAGSSREFGVSENQNYTGCVYLYKQGIRVHIIMISTTTSKGGLEGMVAGAIKKGVVGGNKDMAERFMDQIGDNFMSSIPSAKLIRHSKESEVGGVLPVKPLVK